MNPTDYLADFALAALPAVVEATGLPQWQWSPQERADHLAKIAGRTFDVASAMVAEWERRQASGPVAGVSLCDQDDAA